MKGKMLEKKTSYKSTVLFSKSSKKSLRNFYKYKLSEMSLFYKKQKTKQINQLLLKLPLWKTARFIAVYKAFQQEPSLSAFNSVWKNKICYPVLDGDQLTFYTNKENLWQKNKFNISEPIPKEKNRIKKEEISVFLIPGLAFDRRGGRLGRGQAYYDKTLSSIKRNINYNRTTNWDKKTLFIGLGFVEQLNKTALPLSNHDIVMDCLVTDEFVLWPLKMKKGGK